MFIDGRFSVAAPPERLLANLFDARLMAECLPGCESLEALTDDRYRAVVVVSLAGIKARFDLRVEIVERRADAIRTVTRGEEGGNASSLSATSEVRLDPAPDGTQVAYSSEVSVTGRLGRFALGMMKKKAQAMGDEFAANLQRRLPGAAAPTGVAATSAAPATELPTAEAATIAPPTAEAAATDGATTAAATTPAPASDTSTSEQATPAGSTTEEAANGVASAPSASRTDEPVSARP
jgi:carbon monoxide dehydrogenase subunit G